MTLNRSIASRFLIVGRISSISSRRWRSSASSGVTQVFATSSMSSWTGTCPSGAAATKNLVS